MEMVEAYLKDKKRVIPSAARCEGEYGIDGYFIGVPCVIGAGGIEKILEIELTENEKQLLANTLEAVRKTVAETGCQIFRRFAESIGIATQTSYRRTRHH